MKCLTCGNKMLLLLNNYVCDRCNPPKDGSISIKEKDVGSKRFMLRDVEFCFNYNAFEITIPGQSEALMLMMDSAVEIYHYILDNYDTHPSYKIPGVFEMKHVKHKNGRGERFLSMKFDRYDLYRLFTMEQYVRLLRFMKPHVLGK